MKKNKSLDPTVFVTMSLWHRTMDTLYDVLIESHEHGLKDTVRGVNACLGTLILINRKLPEPLPYPIIVKLPRNE